MTRRDPRVAIDSAVAVVFDRDKLAAALEMPIAYYPGNRYEVDAYLRPN